MIGTAIFAQGIEAKSPQRSEAPAINAGQALQRIARPLTLWEGMRPKWVESEKVKAYPNPSNGQFVISGMEQGMQVEIYDYIGRKINNMEASNATSLQVNIADQPNGIYLVRILTKAGILVNESKVVKTK